MTNHKNISPVDKEDFRIESISRNANTSELKRVNSALFTKFQRASFNLIEAEAQRETVEANIERRRSELMTEIAKKELTKPKSLRRNAEEKKQAVETQLNPLKKQLVSAIVAANAWKQIVFMLRFLGDRVDTLSMLTATVKKHTMQAPSVQIPNIGDNDYE